MVILSEGVALPDDAERARALDIGRSCLVQAPAGSGKTELLVRRVLALLAQVDQPEEILAITFTRKAAAEMRDRVLDALELAGGNEHVEANGARHLAHAAVERDQRMGWGLRSNPSRLRIQTIDGLCAGICRRIPITAGMGATLTVADDPRALYRDAARETLRLLHQDSPWRAAIHRLVVHLDNDLTAVEELLTSLLSSREQWLPHIGAADIDLRARLEGGLEHLIEQRLGAMIDLFPAALSDEFLVLLRYAAGNRALHGASPDWQVLANSSDLAGSRVSDVRLWQAVGGLLLTKEGEPRTRFTVREGFPQGESKSEKAINTQFKQRMLVLTETLARDGAFLVALEQVRGLPDGRFGEDQWDTIDALVQCLRLAAAQLALVFQGRGQVDFAALSIAARQGLGAPEMPSDLALALDYKVRHILVDEFQDTSWTQYELLKALTAGWQPGDGRSLFLVGDPMQSIYRFREADVGVFLHARTHGVGSVALDSLRLTSNFRAQSDLVQWTNASFGAYAGSADDVELGAIAFRQSEPVRPALARQAVTVYPTDHVDKQAEAGDVVRIVTRIRRETPAASIGILVRSRAHLVTLLPNLRSCVDAVQAIETEPLAHRRVVRDLTTLTRALLHPADSVAWLALLRAPWCGLTLPDMESCAQRAQISRLTVMEVVMQGALSTELSESGWRRLRRLRSALMGFVQSRGKLPLRRWVEGAWMALGGPAVAEGSASLDDAKAYFDLLETWDKHGQGSDVDSLIARIESLHARSPVPADNPVQVLTIHRAKGLEFDVVILPGLGHAAKRERHSLLRWLFRPDAPSGRNLIIAAMGRNGGADNPVYKLVADIDRVRAAHESRRLLYVAVTRAKVELHLLAHARRNEQGECVPQPGSLLAHLWPTIGAEFQGVVNSASSSIPLAAQAELPRRLPGDWCPPVGAAAIPVPDVAVGLPPEQVEFSWVTDDARKVGIVVHRALQAIAREGLANWDGARVSGAASAFRVQLQTLGVLNSYLAASCAQVVEAVQRVLEDSRGRWVLQSHIDSHAEWRLTGVLDGRLQAVAIDRSFVDEEGVRWIVDYKVSRHSGSDLKGFLDRECERYQAQLQRYRTLVHQLDASRPIRLGLYFPLLRAWRELPVATDDRTGWGLPESGVMPGPAQGI